MHPLWRPLLLTRTHRHTPYTSHTTHTHTPTHMHPIYHTHIRRPYHTQEHLPGLPTCPVGEVRQCCITGDADVLNRTSKTHQNLISHQYQFFLNTIKLNEIVSTPMSQPVRPQHGDSRLPLLLSSYSTWG